MKKLWVWALALWLMAGIVCVAAAENEERIAVYRLEETGGDVYTVGSIGADSGYVVEGYTYPPEGSALADYFLTSGAIQWGKIRYTNQQGQVETGLIVLNPEVIIGERQYTEVEAAEAEKRHSAFGNSYVFVPMAATAEKAYVLCQELTMRRDADYSAAAVGTLHWGDVCTVASATADGWVEVSVSGQGNAWVRSEYLLIDLIYFTAASVNTPVYGMPDASAQRVGLITTGDQYAVIGLWGDYWAISLRGASGFVSVTDGTVGN